MKVLRDNIEYQGTPQEIAEFMRLHDVLAPTVSLPDTTLPLVSDDVVPLEDIVSESESLRRKLAKDPDYNPFGGVVPPREAEQVIDTRKIATAEKDTGVELI